MELQDSNQKSTSSPTSFTLNDLDEPKEPTYDVVDTAKTLNVNMIPNPAYSASCVVKMDENPAYM